MVEKYKEPLDNNRLENTQNIKTTATIWMGEGTIEIYMAVYERIPQFWDNNY